MNWDIACFRLINGWVGQTDWLDVLGWFSAAQLIYVIGLLVVLQIWANGWRRQATTNGSFWSRLRSVVMAPCRDLRDIGPMTALRAMTAAVLAWSFNQSFYLLHFRARPFVDLMGVNQLLELPVTQKSFPSDHTTVAFALVGTLLLNRPALGLMLLPLAILVAFGRIFVGVHYPSDVLAGAAFGLIWALLANAAWHHAGMRRQARRIARFFRLVRTA